MDNGEGRNMMFNPLEGVVWAELPAEVLSSGPS